MSLNTLFSNIAANSIDPLADFHQISDPLFLVGAKQVSSALPDFNLYADKGEAVWRRPVAPTNGLFFA